MIDIMYYLLRLETCFTFVVAVFCLIIYIRIYFKDDRSVTKLCHFYDNLFQMLPCSIYPVLISGRFFTIFFANGNNFRAVLFAFLSGKSLLRKGLLRSKFFPIRADPYRQGRQTFLQSYLPCRWNHIPGIHDCYLMSQQTLPQQTFFYIAIPLMRPT